MKTIPLYLLMLFTFFSHGQSLPIDSISKKCKYETIVNVDSIKQTDIYDRAKNWIVRTLKSSDNTINLDDSKKSSINATGNIVLSDQHNGPLEYRNVIVNFKFNIYFKDGKYKIIIDNFILNYNLVIRLRTSTPISTSLEDGYKKERRLKGEKATQNTHKETNEAINKLILDLKNTIIANKLPSDKNDW